MRPTPLAQVASVTGGTATGDATVTGVTIDSRRVAAGDLFVALPGERVDGHDYVSAAVAAGAVAALVRRPIDGVPCVVVADPADALAKLARWYATTLPARVVGITGSQGKTSTKDLVAQVLETAGETVAPVGSFNNELGLPLTVLRADDDTRFLVLEMSARGTGHIAWLCDVAAPHCGVVLNVGVAHLGEFGSQEAIAQAKGELVEAARELVVLNADDPLVMGMTSRTSVPVVTFGSGDVRAEGLTLDELSRASFTLVTPEGSAPVSLRLVGEHHVGNALATAAVARWAGLTPDATAAALSAATPRSRWRMEVRETPDGITVLNDAYNANPDSMRAALKTLAHAGRGGRRTWAVLGEMAELGEAAWAAHDEIGRLCVRLDIAKLLVVGAAAKGIHAGAGLEGSWGDETTFADDTDAALRVLHAELRPGDVVLVKASRAAGLERIALALTPDQPEATS